MINKVHHPHDIWIEHYDEIYERWGRGKDLSIKSLPNLDNKIWGLKKKKLVVVGGRPSNGKSVLLLQMAWDFALQGKKVYFFTLEMTKEDCIERLWSLDQGIDNFLITTGKIGQLQHISEHQQQRDDFNKRINTDKLVFIEGYGKTFKEINTVIESFGDADCVIIDYLQMIKDKNTAKQAIDEYIKNLRNYAITKNFCAIIGSQINRATHEQHKLRIPELHELKGSGAIEEVCDLAFILHWEYYYTRDDETKNDYIIRVAKNRIGRTGCYELRFEPEHSRICEKFT